MPGSVFLLEDLSRKDDSCCTLMSRLLDSLILSQDEALGLVRLRRSGKQWIVAANAPIVGDQHCSFTQDK